MRKPRLNLNMKKYSDPEFLTYPQSVLERMTDNAYFPTPKPTLADLSAAIDAYSVALTNAEGLGKNIVAIKNAAREILETLMIEEAQYVMSEAKGNILILKSSGFELAKDPERQYIQAPLAPKLKPGLNSGELYCIGRRVKGAPAYLQCITDKEPTMDTEWKEIYGTRVKHMFVKLIPGKKYWVRIGAVGGNGQTVYSPAVGMFVL